MAAQTARHTSAISLYGLLHKSIRDADFETLEEIVASDVSLLWTCNSIGWTALHFSASHGLGTIARWKWLIGLAAQDGKGSLLYLKLTDAGDSPVAHFFLRELDPLPWQRPEVKQEANRRRECIEKALEDEDMLESVRQGLRQNSSLPTKETRPVRDAESVILDFLCRLQLLLHAAVGKCTQNGGWSLLHALALTGCPRVVAELAIKLYPAQLATKDAQGNLPLHIAASSSSPQSHHILVSLVQKLPDSCSQTDSTGHLPLHLALASGKTCGVVDCLWKAFPLYGAPRDAGSNLPAFLIAAVGNNFTRRHKAFQIAARRDMWRFLPHNSQQRALDHARAEVEVEELTTVYAVLRASPDAISCILSS